MYYRLIFLAFYAIMSIAAVAAPSPAPDLVVGAVVASNGYVTIRVHNQGNAAAGACKVNLSLGTPIGTATNYDQPAIPAGEWRSVRVHVGKPLAGVHYTVRDDVTHLVAESHETNNAKAGVF
jgi:subtilase family serine protease